MNDERTGDSGTEMSSQGWQQPKGLLVLFYFELDLISPAQSVVFISHSNISCVTGERERIETRERKKHGKQQ